jgi:FMN phosphatase YigB (HAD superfamily)
MSPTRAFRALSLDLWFTSILHDPGEDDTWETDRRRVLSRLLRPQDRKRFRPGEIEAVVSKVDAETSASDPAHGICLDPATRVMAYAQALGATLTVSPEEAGRAFSSAGLREHPPKINPELQRLIGPLTRRGVLVISVTNTARRGASWREFFDSHSIGPFHDIVTSCEVGRAKPDPEMFREAARRIHLPVKSILHVGDRWELDVEGAYAAGCGAALYRGLWHAYPQGMYPETDLKIAEGTDVLFIDHLEDLLDLDIWTTD